MRTLVIFLLMVTMTTGCALNQMYVRDEEGTKYTYSLKKIDGSQLDTDTGYYKRATNDIDENRWPLVKTLPSIPDPVVYSAMDYVKIVGIGALSAALIFLRPAPDWTPDP
jgi:hypothetical protein